MSLESVRAWLAEHAPELRLIDGACEHGDRRRRRRDAGRRAGRGSPRRLRSAPAARPSCSSRAAMRASPTPSARPRSAPGRACSAPEETLALTGHPVGGVCPFGLATPLPVYLDVSLQDFDLVYPAAGSRNASVEVAPARLFELVGARWVDLVHLAGDAGAGMTEALQKPGGGLLEGSSYAPARLSQSATGLANRKRINVSPVPLAVIAPRNARTKIEHASGPALEQVRIGVAPPAADRRFRDRTSPSEQRPPPRTGRFRPSASSRRR